MRIYLRRRPGFSAPRGGHVARLQAAIAGDGASALAVDGVFGRRSELALAAWQAKAELPSTGMVDERSWRMATGAPLPSLFERCLAVTAAFEGHGYTFAAGNWDAAYLTWGIVGFTLRSGSLGTVIATVAARHPPLLAETIGAAKAGDLARAIAAPSAERRAFADAISLPPGKYRIRADWEEALRRLGGRAEVQAVQDEVARDIYWRRAMSDLARHGQATEADAALFFDTAVQNGGVDAEKGRRIAAALAARPGVAGPERLLLIARAIAAGSSAAFHDDVLSRRAAIARGEGRVHGAAYRLSDWFIDHVPVGGADLA